MCVSSPDVSPTRRASLLPAAFCDSIFTVAVRGNLNGVTAKKRYNRYFFITIIACLLLHSTAIVVYNSRELHVSAQREGLLLNESINMFNIDLISSRLSARW